VGLFVHKLTQQNLKLVQVNAFLLRIVCIMTTTKQKNWLFKFQSSYRKLYLKSLKGYNRKIITVQTVPGSFCIGYKTDTGSINLIASV